MVLSLSPRYKKHTLIFYYLYTLNFFAYSSFDSFIFFSFFPSIKSLIFKFHENLTFPINNFQFFFLGSFFFSTTFTYQQLTIFYLFITFLLEFDLGWQVVLGLKMEVEFVTSGIAEEEFFEVDDNSNNIVSPCCFALLFKSQFMKQLKFLFLLH